MPIDQKLSFIPRRTIRSIGTPVWSEYAAWEKLPVDLPIGADQRAFRESVARGAKVFREKTFLISDSAGLNSPIGFGNPVRNSCAFCHNMSQMGNDVAPGQVDLGLLALEAESEPDLLLAAPALGLLGAAVIFRKLIGDPAVGAGQQTDRGDAGFFLQLAPQSLVRRFSPARDASRQRKATSIVASNHQKHLAAANDADGGTECSEKREPAIEDEASARDDPEQPALEVRKHDG